MDRACIKDQASDIEALEIDPATQSINLDDSNLHSLKQQLVTEAVTITPQPLVIEVKPNTSRGDCQNSELTSELAAKGVHRPNDWQKRWIHCFNNIVDSV
jgi:hypothetical protein